MSEDFSFLQTGDAWDLVDIVDMKFNFATSTPALWYFDIQFIADYDVFDGGSVFSSNSSASVFDQKDVVRFLLLAPGDLSGFSGADTIHSTLVSTASTSVGIDTVNYRVSFADVMDSAFSEDGGGRLQLVNHDGNSAASPSIANGPGILPSAGDVIINDLDADAITDLAPGQYGFWLHLHELGHAVGGLEDVRNTAAHNTYVDNQKYTIMSDNIYGGVYASGLGLLDIAALQDTYGAINYTRNGNTTYSLGAGLGFSGATANDAFLYTIVDGSGTDTIDASGFNVRAEIDLRAGHFSSIGKNGSGNAWNDDSHAVSGIDPDPGNVAIAYGVQIENAIGTDYDDIFHGAEGVNNDIQGGDGYDTIDYSDASAGVTVDLYNQETTDDGDGGTDTLHSIENVRASDYNDYLYGSDEDNTFYGGKGDDDLIGQDGIDTANYSRLDQSISVTIVAAGSTVEKGNSGGYGTDTVLYDIERIVGTDYGDTFSGSLSQSSVRHGGYGNSEVTLVGGLGNDDYILDLSQDTGTVIITESDATGFDSLHFLNWVYSTIVARVDVTDTDIMKIKFDLSGGPGGLWGTYLEVDLVKDDILNGTGVDVVTLGSNTYSMLALLTAAEAYNTAYSQPLSTQFMGPSGFDVYSIGPWEPGTGGTGAGNDMLPTIDGGDIVSMEYSPTFGGVYASSAFAAEIFYKPVITGSSWSSGSGTITTETYLKEINLYSGISIDAVRLTATSTQGAASLQVHIDSLGQTFTIADFETGKSISGVDYVSQSLHAWVQDADSASLSNDGDGVFTGTYSDGVAPTIASSSVNETYYLQLLNAFDGSIDLTADLTFTGTNTGETLYGLDSRNDTIVGLAGNDTLYGYGGADVIEGGEGNDVIDGGDDVDTVTYDAATSAVTVSLATTSAQNTIGAGTDTISGVENITGSGHNDTLGGNAGNNTINGGDGIDKVSYAAASSAVTVSLAIGSAQNTGGAGTDTLVNIESIIGSVYNDTLTGDSGNNEIEGGAGNDTIDGGTGNDTIRGGNGANSLYGDDGDDVIYGDGTGLDYIYGGDGNDAIHGSGDWVFGNDGDDTFTASIGDALDGGNGTDTAIYNVNSANFVVFRTDASYLTVKNTAVPSENVVWIYNNVETLQFNDTTLDLTAMTFALNGAGWGTSATTYGTSGNDTITLYPSADTVYAGSGSDTVNGGYGDDLIYGEAGSDTLYGGEGNDTIYGGATNNDYMYGGNGNDIIYANDDGDTGSDRAYGGDGNDTLYGNGDWLYGEGGNDTFHSTIGGDVAVGGNGTDSVLYNVASTGMIVYRDNAGYLVVENTYNLSDPIDWIYDDVESIQFTDATLDLTTLTFTLNGAGWGHSMTVTGTSSGETLSGTQAHDDIHGAGGNDTINGGYGDDFLSGDAGNDTLNGGDGSDTANYSNAAAGITASLASNTASNDGDGGSDTFSSIENLTGSANADTLTGNSNANTLIGGAGNDTIYGGGGNDTLSGQAGTDTLYGEGGADIFAFEVASAFSNQDIIADFNTGEDDVLDIHSLLVGFDELTSAITDFVTFNTSGSDSIMSIDRDGTSGTYSAQAIATISGVTGLDADDLLANGHLLAA